MIGNIHGVQSNRYQVIHTGADFFYDWPSTRCPAVAAHALRPSDLGGTITIVPVPMVTSHTYSYVESTWSVEVIYPALNTNTGVIKCA